MRKTFAGTILGVTGGVVAGMAIADLIQREHAIRRNFPVIGRFRYWLEAIGPELRQYIVTNNDEERPFSRDERRWVYASAKRENNYFGFGTDNDLERSQGHLAIKHAAFPLPEPDIAAADAQVRLPAAKVIGRHRSRPKAFRPPSIVNISGMSFGSLSGNAVSALNAGAQLADCLHNTGEGGLSRYHQQGGELIWQLGTGYFGARDDRGRLDFTRLRDVAAENPVRAIEVKLSQGAKPGVGGLLPGSKVTAEIAAARGVPVGKDVASPSGHAEFRDVDSMLDLIERIADTTGLPVGIKSAVGENAFWSELADRMASEERGVDFITVDGAEGGTGAGPLVFTDHVAMPFKLGFARVYSEFARRGIAEHVTFIGSGKLGFPETALLALALGCDAINVGREAMLAIGCIQSQRCHTNRCPTGVATQSPWLMRGLDPADKAPRLANYVRVLRHELRALARACGETHPSLVGLDHLEVLNENYGALDAMSVFGYEPGWGLPSEPDRRELEELMAHGP
jgi:glutamate synthase domain-containing protein 2